jgi:hypothetical protein
MLRRRVGRPSCSCRRRRGRAGRAAPPASRSTAVPLAKPKLSRFSVSDPQSRERAVGNRSWESRCRRRFLAQSCWPHPVAGRLYCARSASLSHIGCRMTMRYEGRRPATRQASTRSSNTPRSDRLRANSCAPATDATIARLLARPRPPYRRSLPLPASARASDVDVGERPDLLHHGGRQVVMLRRHEAAQAQAVLVLERPSEHLG